MERSATKGAGVRKGMMTLDYGLQMVFSGYNYQLSTVQSTTEGLLDSKGRKQLMSILVENPDQIQDPILQEVWQEALLLDETVPYASKRQRKK